MDCITKVFPKKSVPLSIFIIPGVTLINKSSNLKKRKSIISTHMVLPRKTKNKIPPPSLKKFFKAISNHYAALTSC